MAPLQAPTEPVSGGDRRELYLRIGSSVVILPVVALADFLGGALFNALVLAVAFGAVWEWTHLSGGATRIQNAVPAVLVVVAVGAFTLGVPPWRVIGAAAIAIAAACLVSGRMISVKPVSVGAGMIYVGLATAAMIWLRSLPDGLFLVTLLLLVVMSNDIGAYFAGRAIGGPKLFPAVSPKKTWAGAVGGLSCGMIVGWIWGLVSGLESPVLPGIVLAVFISIASQIGDLVESWLKRRARVKDSGSIIPGHGGILDRIDGYLAASPALAAAVLLAGGVSG